VIALFDVNTLIALAWPNHSHHEAAHKWFAGWKHGWATTAFTEVGFVRVSSNSTVLPFAARPVDAIDNLEKLRSIPNHTFWPDTVQGVVGTTLHAARVLGHRQVTDAHLVALAIAHDGTVATFDKAMASLVDADDTACVTIIPA